MNRIIVLIFAFLLPAVSFASEKAPLNFDITRTDTQVVLGIGIAIGVLIVILFSFRSQVRLLVRRELDVVHFQESRLLEVTTAISQELNLQPLLQRIMDTVTEILEAERSTLFLYDAKTGELWSNVAQGLETKEIRFPAHLGLAGGSFTKNEIINIADAYSDDRFNRAFDQKTGYRTTSLLCFPVRTKQGVKVGVVQVLNKKDGPFTDVDVSRLGFFTAQAAVAIENAKLFEVVMTMKNYSEAILQSMTEGVLTLDTERKITRANAAAYRILDLPLPDVQATDEYSADDPLVDRAASDLLGEDNRWVLEALDRVLDSGEPDETLDHELRLHRAGDAGQTATGEGASPATARKHNVRNVNLAVRPLNDDKGARIGGLVIIADISNEKRVRATMARYVPKEVADQLLEEGGDALGGTLQEATVLFSDIRDFTSMAERVGPQGTVSLLNEYFTIMGDIVMAQHGILDKYIGDSIMAVFGAPVNTGKDADHAVRAGIEMLIALNAYNERRLSTGKEGIEIGIGINTDEVISGNIGSAKRMDYTVIGDGVNLAARLETANKTYGTRMLVSEFTVSKLSTVWPMREVDRITVKGKSTPVGIYEFEAAWNGKAGTDVSALFEVFGQGRTLYRQRQWDAAIERFKATLAIADDRASQLYIDRCEGYRTTPPPSDWDGEWVMLTK